VHQSRKQTTYEIATPGCVGGLGADFLSSFPWGLSCLEEGAGSETFALRPGDKTMNDNGFDYDAIVIDSGCAFTPISVAPYMADPARPGGCGERRRGHRSVYQ
jgi:hypothetical protein